jgi:hypothetical protein
MVAGKGVESSGCPGQVPPTARLLRGGGCGGGGTAGGRRLQAAPSSRTEHRSCRQHPVPPLLSPPNGSQTACWARRPRRLQGIKGRAGERCHVNVGSSPQLRLSPRFPLSPFPLSRAHSSCCRAPSPAKKRAVHPSRDAAMAAAPARRPPCLTGLWREGGADGEGGRQGGLMMRRRLRKGAPKHPATAHTRSHCAP